MVKFWPRFKFQIPIMVTIFRGCRESVIVVWLSLLLTVIITWVGDNSCKQDDRPFFVSRHNLSLFPLSNTQSLMRSSL